MKKANYILDGVFLLIVSIFIYGTIISVSSSSFFMFLFFSIFLILYFVINTYIRYKYNKQLSEEKDLLSSEQDIIYKNFENIANGRFNSKNDFKAFVGESNMVAIINKFEGKKQILQNFVINDFGDHTAEIDAIMIHSSGIYVFESKNWIGDISGSDNDNEWKCTYENGTSNNFYNPMKQNAKHIKALKELLAHDNKKLFKSFIVFTDRAGKIDIKTEKYWIAVIKQSKLLYRLNKQSGYSKNILDENDIDRLHNILLKYLESFPEMKYKHINKHTRIY